MKLEDPLHAYKSKRDFTRTPEPAEGGESVAHQLAFVVQKHWATNLHYDFRLELGGTMKSWAVPKEPSFDTTVKRMAVQVEDHPLAYAQFEGTIPAKQYGAGKVIIWDAGTWTPLHDPHQGLSDGNLKFELHGNKLHGRWVLVRMKAKDKKEPAWLLIKEKDSHVRTAAVPDKRGGLPALAIPSELPQSLAPQLATLVTGLQAHTGDWLYEIKFDGYRMLVRNDAVGARLLTRNGHDWTEKLRPLQKEFERLKLPPGWYDGEIVVPNEAGIPDFGALQQAFETERTHEVVLYLFDLPYVAGHDLRSAPLHARRLVLQGLLAAANSDQIRFSETFDANPQSVLASARTLGLEGVIAKRSSSTYRSGRSADWVKLKCGQRQEFVIGGYTAPQGNRTGLGALLLGVNDAQGVLQYAGDVGTGFTEATLKALKKALDAKRRKTRPFAKDANIDGHPTWVAPTLVAEVSFGDWTSSGRIRHAVFRGLRTDKDASTVVREKALKMQPAQANVTHAERVIDTSTGTTKGDLAQYYSTVADLMMSHVKGRPVSLLRAPDGVQRTLFFQKHVDNEKLVGIRQLAPDPTSDHPPLIEVASKQGLLSAAQWNVIEFHTMNSDTKDVEHPDRMVFDLDPGEGVPWPQVQEAAQLMHAFLEQLGLPAFLKTSGGKGLHVVVPIKRLHDWDTVKGFSRALVAHMAKTIPQRFVARSGPKNRVGKIFIDYLRNGRAATTVSAWSARARPGLGVSVPVAWEELPTLIGGDHWTVETVHTRLDIGNTPWAGYARAARGLASAMASLGYVK